MAICAVEASAAIVCQPCLLRLLYCIMEGEGAFQLKHMFYVFYPVHFLVLYGVSMWIAKEFKIMLFDTHAHYDDRGI